MAEMLSVQPVLMVRDVKRAFSFYRRLGFERVPLDRRAAPQYTTISREACFIHLQQHDPFEWTYPVDRPTTRFVVDDVDELYSEFLKTRVERLSQPVRTSWGTYEFHLQDPDGNGLQFCAKSGS